MGHAVQLIIGRGRAVERFLAAWPMARAVEMESDWQAIPVDENLYEAIEAAAPGARRDPVFDVSPLGLEAAIALATTPAGALAYLETDYFGGQGSQSAGAWVDGRAKDPAKSRGIGAINTALRAIGVRRHGDMDEFDTIGLGQRRSMSDYEPEGIVRQRPSPSAVEAATTNAEGGFLPVWAVALIVVGCLAVGLAVAFTRR